VFVCVRERARVLLRRGYETRDETSDKTDGRPRCSLRSRPHVRFARLPENQLSLMVWRGFVSGSDALKRRGFAKHLLHREGSGPERGPGG